MDEQETMVAVEEEHQGTGEARPGVETEHREAEPREPEPREPDAETADVDIEAKELRIAELEGQVAELEERVQGQEAQRQETESQLSAFQEQLTQAVDRYRSSLLASAPEVPEGLVQGNTVEEVDASFGQANELTQRIRDRVEASMARERVPTGSPTRTGADLSSLSSREKIAHALAHR